MAAAQRPWTVAVLLVAAVSSVLLASSSSSAAQPAASPAAAPGPAGGLGSACTNALLNMSDCLGYVGKGSAERRPDRPCCPELAGLVDSNPVCLCELLSGAADSYGIAVDYARALALPGICRVSTPPVSTCTALGYHVRVGPAAAPMSGSPSPMSAVSPAGEGPQFPAAGTSPFASPPSSVNHAARRLGASHLATLAMLPLAAAAVSGML